MRTEVGQIIRTTTGAGFSFITRQKRIQLDGADFYIDLLLFN